MTNRKPAPRAMEMLFRMTASSPWLWGLAFTFAFYGALPHLPLDQQLLYRYFNSHWVEHATTFLFFVGCSVLIGKAWQLPTDRRALRGPYLAALDSLPAVSSSASTLSDVLNRLLKEDSGWSETAYGRRVSAAAEYLESHGTSQGIGDHLAYLAETASSRLHDGYALIRTVTWAIPILGFLGTVIGITIAIANVTPDQLEASLNEVTGGLAVAFDTTALSLGLSMLLVFGTFVIERQEQTVLDQIEDLAVRELLPRLTRSNTGTETLASAEAKSAERLLAETDRLIEHHSTVWQQNLALMRDRWSEQLAGQQLAVGSAMESGVSRALQSWENRLGEVHHSFSQSFEQAAASLQHQLVATQTSHQQQHLEWTRNTSAIWQTFADELAAHRETQTTTLSEMTSRLDEITARWTARLDTSAAQLQAQTESMQEVGQSLSTLCQQGGMLQSMEQQLTQNLGALRVAETLDETLLNLNAAVNLLSARTNRSKAA